MQVKIYALHVKHKYMKIDEYIEKFILSAESKALATYSKILNVVPVSTVFIVDGKIWLINYFLNKTLDNIMENPHVALVCWKGFVGYQIKGPVLYVENGEYFEIAKERVAKILPERVVKGLLIISPESVYDISPPTK